MLALARFVGAQTASQPSADSLAAIREEMQQLRTTVEQLSQQLAGAQREIQDLRTRLNSGTAAPPATADAVAAIAEEQETIKAKVDDQYQTKVESGSRYRVRLSGLILLNVFSTAGSVDNLDLPHLAIRPAAGESKGSFGGTMRQSLFRLDVTGPEWAGAKTSGEFNFDFFGGFPSNPEGVTAGLVRLRTAKMNLDWANTTVTAGQDVPFFSPLSPTSLASYAYPALASAGNLWVWTPQIDLERRFTLSSTNTATFQAGLLDPLTGELPPEYNRIPTAGEMSRTPAIAMRLGARHKAGEQVANIGAGGYYSRQDWGFNHRVNAWAATADWEVPLGPWFSLSGEAYRGYSIGGLGVGVSPLPLARAGGWAQWKFKPSAVLEFNTAFGEDAAFAIGRNASGFANVIYQPRSSLLFSLEYRRLWTSGLSLTPQTASQVSVSSGISF